MEALDDAKAQADSDCETKGAAYDAQLRQLIDGYNAAIAEEG